MKNKKLTFRLVFSFVVCSMFGFCLIPAPFVFEWSLELIMAIIPIAAGVICLMLALELNGIIKLK